MPSTVLGRSGRGGVRATRTVWAWNSLAMFSVDDRRALRQQVIDRASDDDHVTACVLFGSAARGEEDTWSDIDIALQLGRGVALEEVTNLWKAWLGDVANVADTLAIHASGALYRVFLLSNSRQLDLSFWPHDHLRSTGMPVQPIFGTIGGSRARGRGGVRGGSWPWSVCVPRLGGVRRGRPGRRGGTAVGVRQRVRVGSGSGLGLGRHVRRRRGRPTRTGLVGARSGRGGLRRPRSARGSDEPRTGHGLRGRCRRR